MQIAYFVFDDRQQLWKVTQEAVRELWDGRPVDRALPFAVGSELRLISVLLDDNLSPRFSYFLRLEVKGGIVTRESRVDALEAMTQRSRRRYDHPLAQRQFSGWPQDWHIQLAVAVDAPVKEFKRIGIGGPLLMADLWGISIERILDYFDELLE